MYTECRLPNDFSWHAYVRKQENQRKKTYLELINYNYYYYFLLSGMHFPLYYQVFRSTTMRLFITKLTKSYNRLTLIKVPIHLFIIR